MATALVRRLVAAVPGQHIGLQTDNAEHVYLAVGFRRQPQFLSLVSGEWLDNDVNHPE